MSERQLIARVRELFSDRIGDDAAVIGDQVLTTDLLVEDVDFTRAIPLRFIARKSLAVNLSDLAAMGARPSHALVALGLPEWVRPDVDSLLIALAAAAKEHRIEIVGGDLSRADKLTIAITAVGTTSRPLLRSGARPGDRIYLSRPIGGAASGLQLLQKGWSVEGESPAGLGFAERELALAVIQRQVDPEPELELGIRLSALKEVTACIDVSDGLSTDLHHLCEASRCGAAIERERLPIFPDLLACGPPLGIRVQEAVLHGGEEYALLFTSSLRESELSSKLGRPVYAIGRMTREAGVVMTQNGIAAPLEARGWDHFTSGW